MNKLSSLFRIAVATIMVVVAGAAIVLKQEPAIVQAVGDLKVTFPSSPFFSETNMAPGDSVEKTVVVKNEGAVTRLVAVKVDNISRNPTDSPHIDDFLTLSIFDNTTLLNHFDPLKIFVNGGEIILNLINPGETKNYRFYVEFPQAVGNEAQGLSLTFDLSVGAIVGDHLVINEVFFFVDPAHGADCNFGGGNNTALNINTGPNSTNNAKIKVKRECKIKVKNKASLTPSVVLKAKTGGNTLSGNTNAGNLNSGNINIALNFNVIINQIVNFTSSGQSDEWIELYNPTDEVINLKNWKIVDNSGVPRTINANKLIGPGEFRLLAKSKSTFSLFWPGVDLQIVIPLGQIFGDGLDNAGDRVRLLNPSNVEIDGISWGVDTYLPNYTGPIVQGHSIERLVPGFDNDLGSDFEDESSPSPGS